MRESTFRHSWRWFGPRDPVSMEMIRQAGATDVVTALHHFPVGEEWSEDEIHKRRALIEQSGLTWFVAESLPVHEEIKLNSRNRGKWVEKYRKSLRNLGRNGVGVVCYNYMPQLDWSRTDLHATLSDGAIVTKFESRALAAFDLYVLRRRNADGDYTKEEILDAERYFGALVGEEVERLTRAVLLGFPGSGSGFTIDQLRTALADRPSLTPDEYRESLSAFLRDVIPDAEESGIRLAIHPDDPPWSLFGLPRAVSGELDIRSLLGAVDSPSNGLTFCTGSLGAGRHNDVIRLAEQFAGRTYFLHLRNVRTTGPKDFHETYHLEGDVDLSSVILIMHRQQRSREMDGERHAAIPMRPDHGALLSGDPTGAAAYPGYSYLGRLKALSELRGLERGVLQSLRTT